MADPVIVFRCDRRACDGRCDGTCAHTTNPEHAINFRHVDGLFIECSTKLYGYMLAESIEKLSQSLNQLNDSGFELISVTQDGGVYTLFYGRPHQ